MVDYYITTAAMGERPEATLPKKEFLEQLTIDGFWKMINDFYDIVVESDIAFFFPQEEHLIEMIKKHNGKYFIEICGGPKMYSDEIGHLDMIKMHEPFSIPDKARIEWLGCWAEVLKTLEGEISDEAIQSYWNWLEVFSKHTVNFELNKADEEQIVKV